MGNGFGVLVDGPRTDVVAALARASGLGALGPVAEPCGHGGSRLPDGRFEPPGCFTVDARPRGRGDQATRQAFAVVPDWRGYAEFLGCRQAVVDCRPGPAHAGELMGCSPEVAAVLVAEDHRSIFMVSMLVH